MITFIALVKWYAELHLYIVSVCEHVKFGKIIARTNCAVIKTLDQFCMLYTAFVVVYV